MAVRTLREESREDTDPERFALVSRGSSFAITGTETIMRGAVEKSARRGNGKHWRLPLIVPYETTDNDFSLFADSLFPSAGSNPSSNRSESVRVEVVPRFRQLDFEKKRTKRIIVSSILSTNLCLSIAIFRLFVWLFRNRTISIILPVESLSHTIKKPLEKGGNENPSGWREVDKARN